MKIILRLFLPLFFIVSSVSLTATLVKNFDIPSFSYVQLEWDAPNCTNVITNYNIYYGVASLIYTNSISVNTNLTGTVSNLILNTTYYFAATAFDESGLESIYSNEVSTNTPSPPLPPSIPIDLKITSVK